MLATVDRSTVSARQQGTQVRGHGNTKAAAMLRLQQQRRGR
jgi:hypothetical protein